VSQSLSPLAARLARQVADAKNKRVLVADLFAAAQEYDLSLVGDPTARVRFRQALDELVGASLVTLPAAASRSGWDAIVEPPLPVRVTRVDPATVELAFRPTPRVWPSVLEAAGRIASRADEHALLGRVSDWLRDNPAPIRVPVGERSAELFGDEKALGRYRKTRLFISGALTLDLLACYDPPLPFASQHVPGGGPVILLITENLATYTSFLTAARALDGGTRPHLHIAWGVGGSFVQSVLSIPLLDPSPRHLRYFGDLDMAGLRIAAGAARQAAQADLPPVLPAIACYKFLLDGPRHWRRPDDSNRGDNSDYLDACAWLPPELRLQAGELLAAGEKIAQEHLGLKTLLKESALIAGLASLAINRGCCHFRKPACFSRKGTYAFTTYKRACRYPWRV
jgi:hypothetical protein